MTEPRTPEEALEALRQLEIVAHQLERGAYEAAGVVIHEKVAVLRTALSARTEGEAGDGEEGAMQAELVRVTHLAEQAEVALRKLPAGRPYEVAWALTALEAIRLHAPTRPLADYEGYMEDFRFPGAEEGEL